MKYALVFVAVLAFVLVAAAEEESPKEMEQQRYLNFNFQPAKQACIPDGENCDDYGMHRKCCQDQDCVCGSTSGCRCGYLPN